MKKNNHGLAIMRLQPLHNGHVRLIEQMLKECFNVTVLIGSQQEGLTDKNPFFYTERKEMLNNIFEDKINILGISDIHRPDIWPEYVLGVIAAYDPCCLFPVTYYAGNEEDLKLMQRVATTQNVVRKDYSGTDIRDMMYSGSDKWKDCVPKENHELIEKWLKRNNGRLVQKTNS